MSAFDGVILIPQPDPETRNIIVGHYQDVTDVIEENKRLANEARPRGDGWRHMATIPNGLLFKWWIEETNGTPEMPIGSRRFYEEVVAKKLADPEWRALRVDLGPAFARGWRASK
jgi:hypothetical protein